MGTVRRKGTQRIDEQAAEWLVQLENRERPPTPAQQTAFFSWLAQSPDHLRAYFDIADLRSCLEDFDRERRIDLARLLTPRPSPVSEVARSMAATGTGLSSGRNKAPRNIRKWALAAGVACMAIGTALLMLHRFDAADLQTRTGEQRSFKLTDGSIVHLNTRSHVAIDFSSAAREVRLLEGEALFSVEHDPRRPFHVLTDTARIRAVGTQFNVYRKPGSGETTVSVVDGVVQVTATSPNERAGEGADSVATLPQTGGNKDATIVPTRLMAGEEAHVKHGQVVAHRTRADVADAVAWRQRRLVFQDAPLAEVAAEFNRYNTTQIRAEGTVGQERRIAGIFSADHPQSLILHLQRDASLRVEQMGDAFVVRAR